MNREISLPGDINDNERIVRSIFSPVNIHHKKGTVLPNAYRSPSGIDEVSVNRLDYTTPDVCKYLSKKIEQPEHDRSYFGLSVIYAEQIRSTRSDVIYSPIYQPEEDLNPYHSDIKIGYIPEKGQPLPAEFQEKVNKLAKMARLYADAVPDANAWNGPVLD